MLTGFTNYVGFVTQGGSPGAAVPMTEDASNPGVYYKTNVSGGYFDVYLDLDKSGSFLAGDLRLSGVRHGIGADDVSDVNIENFSIELDDLSPSVIAYIDGSGGGADPDGVTLDLNLSGEMQIKDGGISTGKYGDASISASKLQEGAVTTDALGDEVVTTGKVADAAITAVKLAGASVTSDKIAGKIITGEDHITDGSIVGANLEDSAISTAKIQNLAVTGAKIADATINGDTKIIPETISGALLNDETLQARSFIPDTLEAGMMSPTLSFNTTQFERTGAPLLWQLKSSFLATFGVSYILNVLDFGADTSGAGSSSQAFQDAFDAVTDEKGIVLIPPGVYLAKNLTVKANTEIWAFGAIITIGGTAPSGETSPDTWLIKSTGVSGSENSMIRISGGDWRGELTTVYTEQSSGSLFDFSFCKNVFIRDAVLSRSRKHAISFSRSFDCVVSGCRIDKVAGAGVYLAGSTDVFVDKINVTETARGVFAVTSTVDPQRIFVTGSRISVFISGVVIVFGAYSVISGNSIEYVAKTGFEFALYGIVVGRYTTLVPVGSVCPNVNIFGNNVKGFPSYYGIDLGVAGFEMKNVMIANNNILCQNGINIDADATGSYSNLLIQGNLIEKSGSGTTSGITIYGQAVSSIQYNVILGFTYGLSITNVFTSSEGHLIANNRIEGGTYGMAFAKMINSIIRDNFFKDTGDFAFYFLNTANNNYADRNYLLNCAETYSDAGTGNSITNVIEM